MEVNHQCCTCSVKTKRLQELILVNLDLIQQQQELSLSKDRQIQQLRVERNNLQSRLERMERRMSMLQHRNSPLKNRSPFKTERRSSPLLQIRNRRPLKTLESDNLTKQSGRRMGNLLASPEKSPEDRHIEILGSKSPKPCLRYTGEQEDEDAEQSPPTKRQKRQRIGHPKSVKSEAKFEEKPKPKELKARENENIMRTSCMYYVNEIIEELEEECELPAKKPDEDVSVPNFRIIPVPRGWSMEGTENLDEDIFLRRHQKPEQEEKRRKRWDMQRLREQSLYERLQQGRSKADSVFNGSQGSNNSLYTTFASDPFDIKYIEVCDSVPVSAFGFPLPVISKGDFSLPLFDLDVREKDEQSKNSRAKKR